MLRCALCAACCELILLYACCGGLCGRLRKKDFYFGLESPKHAQGQGIGHQNHAFWAGISAKNWNYTVVCSVCVCDRGVCRLRENKTTMTKTSQKTAMRLQLNTPQSSERGVLRMWEKVTGQPTPRREDNKWSRTIEIVPVKFLFPFLFSSFLLLPD